MLSPEKILKILKEKCGYAEGEPVLVGVSGGADSVALLHLLHAAKVPVTAAHVNYGLRGEESDGDEKFVSELCGKLNVPLYTGRTNPEELDQISNNFQDAARKFRYAFFREIRKKESIRWLAVAHNAEDQLETVLMNFMRGTGLLGMSGMLYLRGTIIRPLLSTHRAEIEKYLSSHEVTWRNDSSNESDDYLRNRIRHKLVPVLSELDDRDHKGLTRTMRNLFDSYELLGAALDKWWKKVVLEEENVMKIDKTGLAKFPQPHLLLNYFLDFTGADQQFDSDSYALFISSQPGRYIDHSRFKIMNDRKYIIVTSGFQPYEYPHHLKPGEVSGDWICELISGVDPKSYKGNEALIDPHLQKEIVVRAWEEGDRMQPYGFSGTKKVSDILTEMKVPLYLKANYPVITVNDEIAWIPGYRIAEKFKVTPETKTALHIKWNR